EPAPSVYAPPKIHTITGRRSLARAAPVQRLRYRQSSLVAGESGMSTDTFRRPTPFGWMQTLPKRSPGRTPSHFAGGCVGFHRSAPTGGAPNGMPRNTRTPSGEFFAAATSPASVFTGSGSAAETIATEAATAATATTERLCMLRYSLQTNEVIHGVAWLLRARGHRARGSTAEAVPLSARPRSARRRAGGAARRPVEQPAARRRPVPLRQLRTARPPRRRRLEGAVASVEHRVSA